ncbi:hypothetical protein Q787_04140 [Ornithobacterium rhinotracheale H06-030791]|nr:hypothetical protein Q785_04265 [Ornithobacterium rhinotracheale ORT-UMN 88]KGB67334.1 hypothetical protein Q787_04140 [Ornithobacterium rhinotracheale H06-030791]
MKEKNTKLLILFEKKHYFYRVLKIKHFQQWKKTKKL